MLTGAFSPSGARSAGHEAIAEASDAQDARIARFSASDRDGCATTSLGCSKTVPGCSSALKSKTLSWSRSSAACFPPFEDEWGGARHEAGPPQVSLRPPWLRADARCRPMRR